MSRIGARDSGVAVFSRSHRVYLDEAAAITRRDPTATVEAMRAGVEVIYQQP